jgi:hypothetical protein
MGPAVAGEPATHARGTGPPLCARHRTTTPLRPCRFVADCRFSPSGQDVVRDHGTTSYEQRQGMPNWCARAESDLRGAEWKPGQNWRKFLFISHLGASAIYAKPGCSLEPDCRHAVCAQAASSHVEHHARSKHGRSALRLCTTRPITSRATRSVGASPDDTP